MKTDIQIAQEAQMMPIREVTAGFGITEDDMELYGKYKAKLSDECMERLSQEKDGKLVMPLSITCHHATTDGYHIHLFTKQLQKDMNSFEKYI